jgi:hypothetical protein
MTKYYDRNEIRERMNKDRHEELCKTCCHYRYCVGQDFYCPPYSLAVRWLEYSKQKERQESAEILEEPHEERMKGGTYTDYCKVCYFRKWCKFDPSGYQHSKGKKFCGAMKYVFENVPCPVLQEPKS